MLITYRAEHSKDQTTEKSYIYTNDSVTHCITRKEVSTDDGKDPIRIWNEKDLLVCEIQKDGDTCTYSYTSDNRILSWHRVEPKGKTSLDTFIYKHNGECLQKHYQWSNGILQFVRIHKYDKHGSEYRHADYDFMGDSLIGIDDGSFYYFKDDSMNIFKEYDSNHKQKCIYTYYSNGKVKTRTDGRDSDSYNENGDELESNYVLEESTTHVVKSYNKDNQLTKSVTKYKDSDGYVSKSKTVITYKNGVRKCRKEYGEDGKLWQQYDYNEKGDIIKFQKRCGDEILWEKLEYTYWK